MNYFQPKKYVKAESPTKMNSQINFGFAFRSKFMPYMLPVAAVFLMVTQVAIPLVSFTTQDITSRPVAASALGYATGFQEFEFKELNENNVLGATTDSKTLQAPEFFYITIPKLKIKDALIETNAADLKPDEALGHYPGSALPGENGNSFIFGHSVLPMFYNPKNYKTIFSTLDKLEAGDEIFIQYNNKEYVYKVEKKRELIPENVHPLEKIKPAYLNESTLVLMTCSPAGTKLRRLLVDAVLIN